MLDYFFNMADSSKDGNIDYSEFYRVFYNNIPALQESYQGQNLELDWKMRFMKNLNDKLS